MNESTALTAWIIAIALIAAVCVGQLVANLVDGVNKAAAF